MGVAIRSAQVLVLALAFGLLVGGGLSPSAQAVDCLKQNAVDIKCPESFRLCSDCKKNGPADTRCVDECMEDVLRSDQFGIQPNPGMNVETTADGNGLCKQTYRCKFDTMMGQTCLMDNTKFVQNSYRIKYKTINCE